MRDLLETDLRWRCGTVQRIEDISPGLLEPNAIPDYIGDLRETARALREALHAAIGVLADAEQRNERLRVRNRELTMCRAGRDSDRNRDSLRNSASEGRGTGVAEQSIAKKRKAEEQESSRDRGWTGTRQAPGQVQAQGQRQAQKQLRPRPQAQGKVASWT